MKDAPKDGTRILLHYKTSAYCMGSWLEMGEKWEDARWIDGRFEAWAGSDNIRSSSIMDKNVIGWMDLPEK